MFLVVALPFVSLNFIVKGRNEHSEQELGGEADDNGTNRGTRTGWFCGRPKSEIARTEP